MPPRLSFTPPLLNSATPWATSAADLAALYACPHTGAVTTRTALLDGFAEDPGVHRKLLFAGSSLNTYGYSPHPLRFYLDAIAATVRGAQTKPFIVSVAGGPAQLRAAVVAVAEFAARTACAVLVEINLSCPNIPGKPPPAYDLAELLRCLDALEDLPAPSVPLGLKTPPFTHDAEYRVLLDALKQHPRVVSFITSTNTLGSALHVSRAGHGGELRPTLASASGTGTGIGGLGGACIHWLSLGNVATIRRLLDADDALRDVVVIGVGGVADHEGWLRMRSVGAAAVGVGTALGEHGVGVFARILGV